MNIAVADVHADVPGAVGAGARRTRGRPAPAATGRTCNGLGPLRRRVVRQRDADLSVDVLDEAGAVEALAGRAAAPDVADAEVALGELHRVCAHRGGTRLERAGGDRRRAGAPSRVRRSRGAGGRRAPRRRRPPGGCVPRDPPARTASSSPRSPRLGALRRSRSASAGRGSRAASSRRSAASCRRMAASREPPAGVGATGLVRDDREHRRPGRERGAGERQQAHGENGESEKARQRG